MFKKHKMYEPERRLKRCFNVFSFLIGLIALADIICYNVLSYKFASTSEITKGEFWTKLIPMPLFILLPVVIQLIYKINTYSLLIITGLLFCWIGDFMLLFYSPWETRTEIYFYLGGSSFLVARFFWSLMLILFPEKGCHILKYNRCKLSAALLVTITIYTGFGVFFYINSKDHLFGALILVYFILGFAPPVALAYLRIGKLSQETFKGSALTFAGLLCFNFSDTILFFSLLSDLIPLKWSFLSNNIYWVGMFLLALSSSREKIEPTIQYPNII